MPDFDVPRLPGDSGNRANRHERVGREVPGDREAGRYQFCLSWVRWGGDRANSLDVPEFEGARPGERAAVTRPRLRLNVHGENPEGARLQQFLEAVGGPDQPRNRVERGVG